MCTRRDARALMVARAIVQAGSAIPEPPCQLPTRTHIVHKSTCVLLLWSVAGARARPYSYAQEQGCMHAPIPRHRNRSACVLLFLGIGIGACTRSCHTSSQERVHAPVYKIQGLQCFSLILSCVSRILERRKVVHRAFWRGEILYKGVRGVLASSR